MTEVVTAPEEQAPDVSSGLGFSAFGLPPLPGRPLGIGLAVLASVAAAAIICAVLPRPASSSVPPAGQPVARAVTAVHTAAASPAPAAAPVATPLTAGFDVGKAWSEEQARLYAATNPRMRGVRADAWAPAGGLAILMTNPFASVAGTQSADNEKTVPMPPPVPVARAGGATRQAVAHGKPVAIEPQVASLPPSQPEPGYFSFFRKLFANPDDAAKTMLAANPDTAIYDIERHVVYLPGGEKLEAHSGYGKWMDDPHSVARKNLGVTPPNVYRVTFRQKLFHGVRALRLTPVGDGKMYGRDGMLAHSYMLGADGQSNGCVSVKNYAKFLEAYKDGKFKQLIVVRSIEAPASTPSQVASAAPGNV